MTISEAKRFEMHLGLKKVLGDDVANTVMEHLPPSGWGDVARARDIDLLDRRLSNLETRFHGLETRFHGLEVELHEFRHEFNTRLDSFARWAFGLSISFGTLIIGILATLALTR
jgi:hypothetical protein